MVRLSTFAAAAIFGLLPSLGLASPTTGGSPVTNNNNNNNGPETLAAHEPPLEARGCTEGAYKCAWSGKKVKICKDKSWALWITCSDGRKCSMKDDKPYCGDRYVGAGLLGTSS